MDSIRSVSQPIVAFLTEYVWRPLSALQTKTKWVALAVFGGLSAYLVGRACLKGLKVTFHPLDKMKACYQGKDLYYSQLEERCFKTALDKFKAYRMDPSNQKDEQDQANPAVIHLSREFAKENGLGDDCEHAEMFVRYLVLEEMGFAYKRSGGDFYLYTDQASIPNDPARVYTKERLLDIHHKLEALAFPSLNNYTLEEQSIVKEILDCVKQGYYERFDDNVKRVRYSYIDLNTNPLASQVMDKLVSQCPDLVYAWNASRFSLDTILILQLKKGDPISDSYQDAKWSAWRDKDVVAAEKEIKEKMSLQVSQSQLSDHYLALAEKVQLKRFVDELKTKPPGNRVGVWFATHMKWVLDSLKERGNIYSFVQGYEEFKGWKRSFYRIYITEEDYNADQKRRFQEAEEFREENVVEIHEEALRESELTTSQQKMVQELVGDLNQRHTWGAFVWDCEVSEAGESILKFLQDQKVIYDYEKAKSDEEGFERFKIYVKWEDWKGPQ